MKLSLPQFARLLVSLFFALGVFWWLYKDIAVVQLRDAVAQSSFFWISVSVVLSLFGYWIRAWRWKLLVEAGEQRDIPTMRVFWALMFGYLVNLIIPRAGEVARCGALKRTDGIPVGNLFGTVVVERMVDMVCMLATVGLAFFIERTVFVALIERLIAVDQVTEDLSTWLPYAVVFGLLFFGLTFWLYRRIRRHSKILQIRQFIRQFVRGILSVSALKNPGGFWLSTAGIWVIYYGMMYFVAIAVPSTAALSPSSVLMVMVMGSIGMIVPVQGGIGTFHALVAFILLFYGIPDDQGKIFAIIVHASQVITIFIVGMVSVLVLTKSTMKSKPANG